MSVAVVLLLFAFKVLRVEAAVPVSFSSFPAYLDQRDCVKLCLWHVNALDDLIAVIGCSPPWVNECFCLPELASSAADFLSSCVASRCTAPRTAPAITSALSAYNSYCSYNGYSVPTVASIQSYSAYVSQPNCVQQCVWNPAHLPSDDLMPAIGCSAPWDNSCLCNTALAGTAGTFLSTCIASKCSTGVDASQVTDALSLYDGYCSAAGLPLSIAAVNVQTTSMSTESRSTGSTTTGMASVVVSPTITAAGVREQRSGISTGAIAGIAVGSAAGAAVLVASAAFIMYKRRHRTSETTDVYPTVEFLPPNVHEKPTDFVAIEADWGTPQSRHELP